MSAIETNCSIASGVERSGVETPKVITTISTRENCNLLNFEYEINPPADPGRIAQPFSLILTYLYRQMPKSNLILVNVMVKGGVEL